MIPRITWILLLVMLGGCRSLLPRGETVTDGQWQSFWDVQQTFDKITPYRTTVEGLKQLRLDPMANPNVTILNYSDILGRFIPSPAIDAADLDPGVRDCIKAKTACIGYVIDQRVVKRKRYGNFWLDFLNFRRKVDITGWRFNGVILIKGDMVVYKLTGGQPAIRELEESTTPLGPFQELGNSTQLFR